MCENSAPCDVVLGLFDDALEDVFVIVIKALVQRDVEAVPEFLLDVVSGAEEPDVPPVAKGRFKGELSRGGAHQKVLQIPENES